MDGALGPRIVYYVAKDGSHRPIKISIEFGNPEVVDLGDNQFVTNQVGYIDITSDWFERRMRLFGADQLQVIYRCLSIGDIWLQKACKDAGVTLFTIVPDRPAETSMDVFT